MVDTPWGEGDFPSLGFPIEERRRSHMYVHCWVTGAQLMIGWRQHQGGYFVRWVTDQYKTADIFWDLLVVKMVATVMLEEGPPNAATPRL